MGFLLSGLVGPRNAVMSSARKTDFAKVARIGAFSAKLHASRREEPKTGQIVLNFRLIT